MGFIYGNERWAILVEKALLMTRRCGYNISAWCWISRRHEAARKVHGGVGGNFCVSFPCHSFAFF